jgi:hypothetical protein
MTWRYSKAPTLRSIVGILLLLQGSVSAAAANGKEEATPAGDRTQEVVIGGGDITRPSRRIDLRFEVEEGEEETTNKLTLRYDQPIKLSDRWQLNLRADLPFASVDLTDDDTDHHPDTSGVGDVLLQAVFGE